MEGGGEGEIGRKWVWTGRFEGGVCEGGGPQARRRGAPPKRAEPVCPPSRRAACGRVLRLLRSGGGDEGKGWGGQRGKAGGGAGVGAQPLSAEPKAAGGACGDRPEGGRAAP